MVFLPTAREGNDFTPVCLSNGGGVRANPLEADPLEAHPPGADI